MSRKISAVIVLFCFSFSGIAQNKIEISGKVIDKTSGNSLPVVSISLQYSLSGAITDNVGNFSINVPDSNSVLIFSMIGYETKELTIKQLRKQNFTISLKASTTQLKEIVITGNKIQSIVESKMFYVADYAFVNNGIVLLTFRKKISDAELILTDESGNVISSINVPETPEKLFKDCLGNVHLIAQTKTYEVYFDSLRKSIQYLLPVSRKYFETIMYPCVASMDGNLYFKQGSKQAVIYTYQNITMLKPKILTAAYWSRAKTRMYKDEGRFQGDKASIGCTQAALDASADFAEHVIFTPVFAPLFKMGHSIFIFNHSDSIIESYDIHGDKLAEVKINQGDYLKKNGWKEQIFVDERQNKVYTIYMGTWTGAIPELKEINLSSGAPRGSYAIPFSFPQNIQVHNGYAYFICKGKGAWDDTKYLYRMRLE